MSIINLVNVQTVLKELNVKSKIFYFLETIFSLKHISSV